VPEYKISINDMENDHREYEVDCILKHINSGLHVGSGGGCCSTKEGKYKYRTGGGELADIEIPKKYWDIWKSDPPEAMKVLVAAANAGGIEGNKFGKKKDEEKNKWVITTFGEKVEHDNPADYYNTIKKMAMKRALVSAVIQATAASDIFTQDIEDLNANGVLGNQAADPAAGQKPAAADSKPAHEASTQSSQPDPQPAQTGGKKITPGQVGLVQARCAATGHKEEALKMLKDYYKVDSTKDLLMDKMNEILEMIGTGQDA
jgi:hypothetical protein